VTAEMIAPSWMRDLVTAEQYESRSEDQCAGVEIVDGMMAIAPFPVELDLRTI
jgi:hypothetical protein